jgi:hypothetical protein
MTAKDILIEARRLIADPAHWCQRMYAQTADGRRTGETDSDAVAFCSAGAVMRAYQNTNYLPFGRPYSTTPIAFLQTAGRELHPHVVGQPDMLLYVNDDLDHAAVLQMFDRAIMLAEQAESPSANS